MPTRKKLLAFVAAAVGLFLVGSLTWEELRAGGPGEGFVSSNGRVEATELDVSTRVAGRLTEMLVDEGDFVEAGQVLARIQADTLVAQLDEAVARLATLEPGS